MADIQRMVQDFTHDKLIYAEHIQAYELALQDLAQQTMIEPPAAKKTLMMGPKKLHAEHH